MLQFLQMFCNRKNQIKTTLTVHTRQNNPSKQDMLRKDNSLMIKLRYSHRLVQTSSSLDKFINKNINLGFRKLYFQNLKKCPQQVGCIQKGYRGVEPNRRSTMQLFCFCKSRKISIIHTGQSSKYSSGLHCMSGLLFEMFVLFILYVLLTPYQPLFLYILYE